MFNSESIREQGLTFNAQRATLATIKKPERLAQPIGLEKRIFI